MKKTQTRNINHSFLMVAIASVTMLQAAGNYAAAGTVNLAQGQPATQGSTGWRGAASRAVDGNRDGLWKKSSVSHTGKRSRARNNWWQVDLGSEIQIGEIKVFNRVDCCSNRLSGAKVYIGNSPYSGNPSTLTEVSTLTGSAGEQSVVLDKPATGRYVVVKAAGKNYLSLAEVEVFSAEGNGGESITEPEVENTVESNATEETGNTDVEPQTVAENPMPMHHNMHGHPEHMRILNLVNDLAATHITTQSGAWEDQSTWGGGIPDDGARVIIAEGHEVEVGSVLEPALRSLRVDGKLSFNPAQDTGMTFDTLVVNRSGALEIGSESQPVEDGKTAHLIVADYEQQGFEISDPHSPDYDPAKVGLGIISLGGAVQMFGQEKSAFVSTGNLERTTSVIQLDEAPDGWKTGDKIVITNGFDTYNGNGYSEPSSKYRNSEVRRIEKIEGDVLTLNKALELEHTISKPMESAPDFDLHVVNVERNVKIETIESGRAGTRTTSTSYRDWGKETFENRGHIMLMSSDNVSINYVELGHLGRSSKPLPANDTVFNDDGSVASIGTNPRARYPLHFHRAGSENLPAMIKGNVVFTSPGWGFVNHGSNVEMISNVAYSVAGASFVTERGDERGSFIGNFSVATPGGSDAKWHGRSKIEDFGHTGNGFWFQGMNIRVNDNIANGCGGACYNFVGMGIDGIPDSAVRNQRLIEFNNNVAYNSRSVMLIWGMNKGSVFNDLKAYAVKGGIDTTLTRNHTFNNTILVAADSTSAYLYTIIIPGTGFNSGYKTRGFTFKNSYVVGYKTGIYTPWGIGATIENGYFDNQTDISIRNTALSRRFNNKIIGDITFADDNIAFASNKTNIAFSYNGNKTETPRHLYTVRNIVVDIESLGRKYAAYDYSQAADYVPFKNKGPAELKGLTNAEILDLTSEPSVFRYWAKKLRVNNSSLKQLVPGGKLMPDNVVTPNIMSNLYFEDLGEASVPNSFMTLPESRSPDSSTLSTGLTYIPIELDVQGCVVIGNVCAQIGNAYIPGYLPDY